MTNDMNYIDSVREDILNWLETVRWPDEGWGRWKYNAAMYRNYALISSRQAITIQHQLGVLEHVPDQQKTEAVAFLQSTQDPDDGQFKDPLVTETDRVENAKHSWDDIYGQMNAAGGLRLLGAQPLHPLPRARFADLRAIDPADWVRSLSWENPWHVGERFSRCIRAYVKTHETAPDSHTDPILAAAFRVIEEEVLDPDTGLPSKRGCDSTSVAMAGLFKIISGYLAAGRTVPHAERGIDSTLALQHDDGEFEFRGNMCINWDAVWVLRQLDQQLQGAYRHDDIVAAGSKLADFLMANYRRDDGAFAFNGAHCTPVHHSIRLSDPLPISDTIGTSMCLRCLAYADAWNTPA